MSSLQKRAYKIKSWTDTEDFLSQLARLSGKLLKGGDPDLNTAARMMLYDWQRGKIPFFSLPPGHTEAKPVPLALAAASDTDGVIAAAGVDAEDAELVESLPVPVNLVTEEDAAAETGAAPEAAAAAARAVRDIVLSAAAAQARCAIPVQADYFMPEDERKQEGEEDADEDLVTDAESSAEGDDDDAESSGNAEDSAGDEPKDSDDEEVAAKKAKRADARLPGGKAGFRGADVAISADSSAPADQRVAAGSRAKNGGKKAAAAVVAEDDGEVSDGYGEDGLSWEAVLAAMQVRGSVMWGL